METSIGVDLVEIESFSYIFEKSPRFKKKVFTLNEIQYCENRNEKMQHYAARFAMKEAAIKALRTKIGGSVSINQVEVVNDKNGIPQVNLSKGVSDIFVAKGFTKIAASISHSNQYAVAFIMLY